MTQWSGHGGLEPCQLCECETGTGQELQEMFSQKQPVDLFSDWGRERKCLRDSVGNEGLGSLHPSHTGLWCPEPIYVLVSPPQ